MGFIRIYDLQETVFLCLCIFLRWFIALMRFSKGLLIPHQRVRTTYLEVNLVALVIKCCITNFPKIIGMRQYMYIISQIVWQLGLAQQGLLQGFNQGVGRGCKVQLQVQLGWNWLPGSLSGCWQDSVLRGLLGWRHQFLGDVGQSALSPCLEELSSQ